MLNGFSAIAHLLDDVIDQSPFHENDSPGFDAACESATSPKIDQKIRLIMVNQILSCRRRADLAPTAVKELEIKHSKLQVGKFAEG